jgi:hypothetical protein
MRVKQFALPWSALVTLTFAAGACATGGRSLDPDAAPRPSWRAERDSIAAQRMADEVGPRVTIRAVMDHFAGSRHVEASFHMYDDAYVLVGHLDAAGRMRIVFPQDPNDDGYVRADKIYHVPNFFAGFADEYRWRYSEYSQRYRNTSGRYDSYDAGLGYVFIIASWRPMRLDRITSGDRWESYEIADVNYMSDPREAIEELAGLIAGDNREAYTIEYAHYSTTNYGNYSLAAFNLCYDPYYQSARFGYGFGFASLGFSPFLGFGYSPYSGYGNACGDMGNVYGAYAYNWRGYTPGATAPPIFTPPVIVPPTRGTPILHRPRFPGDTATGGPVNRRPGAVATDQPSSDNAGYRRRGLLAEDATPPRRGQAIRRLPTDVGAGGSTTRPGLSEMMNGRLRGETGRSRDGYTPVYRVPADDGSARARGTYRTGVSRPSADDGSPRGTPSGSRIHEGSRPSYSQPHGVERPSPRSESPRRESGGASSAPARAQPSAPPPSAPPRSEPASSSGSDRRKPGH